MNAASSFNEEDLNRSLEEEIARYENMATQVSDRVPSNIVHQSKTIQPNLNEWGNRLIVGVIGFAIGGFGVKTLNSEIFEPIGFGPALISLAPGIENQASLFLSQYRQTATQNLSDRAPQNQRSFRRSSVQVEVDQTDTARI